MKLFIVALKGPEHSVMPQCSKDTLACAKLFSGMEIIPLSDFDEPGWLDASPYMARAKAFRKSFINVCGVEPRELPAIMRWFIMDEYLWAHDITEPIAQIDWEVIVFHNLESHFNKLGVLSGDLGDTVDKNIPSHNRTAPYVINNHSAIYFFTSLLESHVRCKTPLLTLHKCGGDMNWWEHARTEGGFTPVDLSVEVDNSLFDLNIMLEQHIYESKDGSKRVFWKEGKPYFKRKSDGAMVQAIAIHCFWTWRNKTSELLQRATSNYTGE